MSNTFDMRNKIAIHICDSFFDGSRSIKGKIIKDFSQLDTDYLIKLNDILITKHDYIANAVNKKADANGFNTPYGKFRYIYSIVRRLIKESELPQ